MSKGLIILITTVTTAFGLFFLANAYQSPGYNMFGEHCVPYPGNSYCVRPIWKGLAAFFLIAAFTFYYRASKFWPPLDQPETVARPIWPRVILAFTISLAAILPIKAFFEIMGSDSRVWPANLSVMVGVLFFWLTARKTAKQEVPPVASHDEKEPLDSGNGFQVSQLQEKIDLLQEMKPEQASRVSSPEEHLVKSNLMEKQEPAGPAEVRDRMNDQIKIAAIIGGAIFGAVALWIYFSPYHSCVRSLEATGRTQSNAVRLCAKFTGGH